MRGPLISLVFTLWLVSFHGSAQDQVAILAISITDSTDSEYQKVLNIYNWVTHNIKYDVKKFVKFDYTQLTAEEVVKKKKGTCGDYAELVKVMCESVGVEVYTVHGYSKGYMYCPNMPFMRGNHSWNVVRADTNWIIIDANWGAGSLTNVPGFFNKVVHYVSLKRRVISNNKTVFVPNPNMQYFDIKTEAITKTHYPLDPKWLLSESPESYARFISDTNHGLLDYPNYLNEIEGIRHKDADYQYRIEGERANKNNPLNSFDQAVGYMNIAAKYDIDKEITESNLWQFEKYYDEFSLIYSSSVRHREVIDSVYKNRFNSLKDLSRQQKRITGKIKSKAKSAEKSFHSNQQRIAGKNKSYNKKMSSYVLNIGRAELKMIDENAAPIITEVDTAEAMELTLLVEEKNRHIPVHLTSMDSLEAFLVRKTRNDALLDDSIFHKNLTFNKTAETFTEVILSDKEENIRKYADSILFVYDEINDLLNKKSTSHKNVLALGVSYNEELAKLQGILKQQLGLYQKLYKASGYGKTVAREHNSVNKKLIQSYRAGIEFTKKLTRHNIDQKDVRRQNLEALRQQRKSIAREYQHFVEWYEKTYQREKETYNSEKSIIGNMRSASLRKLKKVEIKLEKYKQEMEE